MTGVVPVSPEDEMTALQAVAIRHVAFEDLGLFADVLGGRGFDVSYVEATSNSLADLDALAPALLVVLGGPIGAYEESAYPFLRQELRLLERRLAAGQPTLGICLGAQVMARALGARVFPGSGKEIGWGPLTLTDEGQRSPLRHLVRNAACVLHWHGDTFDLPSGGIRLASTPSYQNQAFSWGAAALALQFHSEVTAAGVEAWLVGHAAEIAATSGVSVQELREETAQWAPAMADLGRACFDEWLDQQGLGVGAGRL